MLIHFTDARGTALGRQASFQLFELQGLLSQGRERKCFTVLSCNNRNKQFCIGSHRWNIKGHTYSDCIGLSKRLYFHLKKKKAPPTGSYTGGMSQHEFGYVCSLGNGEGIPCRAGLSPLETAPRRGIMVVSRPGLPPSCLRPVSWGRPPDMDFLWGDRHHPRDRVTRL